MPPVYGPAESVGANLAARLGRLKVNPAARVSKRVCMKLDDIRRFLDLPPPFEESSPTVFPQSFFHALQIALEISVNQSRCCWCFVSKHSDFVGNNIKVQYRTGNS